MIARLRLWTGWPDLGARAIPAPSASKDGSGKFSGQNLNATVGSANAEIINKFYNKNVIHFQSAICSNNHTWLVCSSVRRARSNLLKFAREKRHGYAAAPLKNLLNGSRRNRFVSVSPSEWFRSAAPHGLLQPLRQTLRILPL